MSDSLKDAIAKMAMEDMFGAGPEGQKIKETYQQTGRVVTTNDVVKAHTREAASEQFIVVKPIDYKKVAAAVSEQQLAESLSDDGFTKEKDSAITSVANEACEESKNALAKILRRLR